VYLSENKMTSVEGRNVPNKDVAISWEGKREVIMLGPVRLEVLEDGSNTDNRIGAVTLTLPPNSSGPPQHWHQVGISLPLKVPET
jgi:hypothetical protein